MMQSKQLAIFMDNTGALLMELYNHRIVSRNIVFKSKENEEFIQYHYLKPLLSTDKQWHQSAYYKELGDIIKNYEQVVIFGSSRAKKGLYEFLETDHHFRNIRIQLVTTKKMTDSQIHEFVLNYYK
jgi:hypothetical protein